MNIIWCQLEINYKILKLLKFLIVNTYESIIHSTHKQLKHILIKTIHTSIKRSSEKHLMTVGLFQCLHFDLSSFESSVNQENIFQSLQLVSLNLTKITQKQVIC